MTSWLQRLRGRSAGELIERSRQVASRWLERQGFGDLGEPTGSRLERLIGVDPMSVRVDRQAFFPSFADREATVRALADLDPDFRDLRTRADRILDGRFDLLGHRDVSFGAPIDWGLDPVAGVRSPKKHWSSIDFLDPAVVGDHKLVWELSRHQSLLTLGQAWYCTRDPRYAGACVERLNAWLDANPPKTGVHWASSLEIAFRAITWVWILALLDDVIAPELRRRMIAYLAIAGRHIERHLSTWFSPNTHLTGEALSLFVMGTALPQLRDASRWKSLGARILLDWFPKHVREDGTYVEQSTWYHRYTVDFYLLFLVLAERTSLSVRKQLEQRLIAALEHLCWIARPDGSVPLIGDDDGGKMLLLDHRTAHDSRTPLAVGAVLFNRKDFAAAGTPVSSEMVWLLGADGPARFRAVVATPPDETSRAFPEGGLYVMRSGWESRSSVMTIDAGPHGFLNAGHSHADALSIDLTVAGQPALVDPGTFTYTMRAADRDHFRSTAAHNAAVVDGVGAASVAGPFQWSSRVEARANGWFVSPRAVLFSGSHTGFERLRPPISYSRTIVFRPPDLWIVRDHIAGDDHEEHELSVHWQCAIGLMADAAGKDTVVTLANGENLFMRVAEPEGEWRVENGAVSRTYGVKETAPHLVCRRRGTLPLVVTTVIHVGASVALDSTDGYLDVRWRQHHGLLVHRNSAAPGWLETDAAVAWIDMDDDGPVEVIAADVSRLICSGEVLLASSRREGGIVRMLGRSAVRTASSGS